MDERVLRGVDETCSRIGTRRACALHRCAERALGRPTAALGTWCTRSLRNPAAATLPITATPSAPPTWRVVSLIAEPTPARAAGTDPMIEAVAGAINRPIPAANVIWLASMIP